MLEQQHIDLLPNICQTKDASKEQTFFFLSKVTNTRYSSTGQHCVKMQSLNSTNRNQSIPC